MAKTRAKAKANAKAKAKPPPKAKAKAKPQPKPKLGVQDKKINKAHKAKKPKKRRLHRFPKKRHFTNPWWMIPITFWILVTVGSFGISFSICENLLSSFLSALSA